MASTETISGDPKIGEALGRIASGVYIATAEHEGKKVGMLASWVMQAGFEPPTVSIAIAPERELYQVVKNTGRLTLNVISKSNHNLMKAFGKYSPDQFDKVHYRSTYCGLALQDAIATMDCVVKTRCDAGDHVVLIAEVVKAEMLNRDLDPMVHLRDSGFHY